MASAGSDNRLHAHRHALHALEDFRVLEDNINRSQALREMYGEHVHAISHHLRHAVYRIGLEIADEKNLR